MGNRFIRGSLSDWDADQKVLELIKDNKGKKADILAMCLNEESNIISWQQFWEKHTKEPFPETCCFKDCENKPSRNAGLYKIDNYPEHLFTIPACNTCRFKRVKFQDIKNKTKAVKITDKDMVKFSSNIAGHIRVVNNENAPKKESINIPIDATIALSAIRSKFDDATGLKCKNEETKQWTMIPVVDGVLSLPEGWGNALYVVERSCEVPEEISPSPEEISASPGDILLTSVSGAEPIEPESERMIQVAIGAPINIPIAGNDATIPLSTIQEQFPGATGLSYTNQLGESTAIRLVGDDFHPPMGGWENALYIAVVPTGIACNMGNSGFKSSPFCDDNQKVLKLTRNEKGKKSDTLAMCSHLDKESNIISWQQFWEKRTKKHWPSECCFKHCPKKPIRNVGLYQINNYPEHFFTIPACNTCKFKCIEFEDIKNKTEAVNVTAEDMLKFSASNLARLKVYEIKEGTKVKKTEESTRSKNSITLWKQHTRNKDYQPNKCSFEDCKGNSIKGAYVKIEMENKHIQKKLFIIPICKRCRRKESNKWKQVRKGTLAALKQDNTEEPNED